MNGSREPAWCFPAATATTGAGDDGGARTASGRRADGVWAAGDVGAADDADLGSLAASMSSASSGGPGATGNEFVKFS